MEIRHIFRDMILMLLCSGLLRRKCYITTGYKKIGAKLYKFNASGACLNP